MPHILAGMDRVCVFCGSSVGRAVAHHAAAAALGEAIASRGLTLVYGGARVGLMGAVADAALAAGGRVIGVIPASMVDREIAHTGLSDLRIVQTMHERKAEMERLSDAFVTLPGAMGTLDETCEMLTWGQLGLHAKPCGLLNVDGYYDPFLALLDRAVTDGLLRPQHRAMVLVDTTADALLDRCARYEPPVVTKWLDRREV
jgi:uncharacterized protein (TIGR00730 family)